MMKHFIAAALGACICVPHAAAESLLQRSDWQDRKFETYLPRATTITPWLEIDTKTRMPKGDVPIGRVVASFRPFVLPTRWPDVQMSTNATLISRSM